MLYYTANNTNDYGEGVHQIAFVLYPYAISYSDLSFKYDFVAEMDGDDLGEYKYSPIDLVWDVDAVGYVRVKNDVERLEDQKILKITEISEQYEVALDAGCLVQNVGTHGDFRVDCRPKDIANWTSTMQLLEVVDSLNSMAGTDSDISNWITGLQSSGIDISNGIPEITVGLYDNTEIVLTAKEFKQTCVIIGLHYKSLFEKKWILRSEAKEASTFTELEAIVW